MTACWKVVFPALSLMAGLFLPFLADNAQTHNSTSNERHRDHVVETTIQNLPDNEAALLVSRRIMAGERPDKYLSIATATGRVYYQLCALDAVLLLKPVILVEEKVTRSLLTEYGLMQPTILPWLWLSDPASAAKVSSSPKLRQWLLRLKPEHLEQLAAVKEWRPVIRTAINESIIAVKLQPATIIALYGKGLESLEIDTLQKLYLGNCSQSEMELLAASIAERKKPGTDPLDMAPNLPPGPGNLPIHCWLVLQALTNGVKIPQASALLLQANYDAFMEYCAGQFPEKMKDAVNALNGSSISPSESKNNISSLPPGVSSDILEILKSDRASAVPGSLVKAAASQFIRNAGDINAVAAAYQQISTDQKELFAKAAAATYTEWDAPSLSIWLTGNKSHPAYISILDGFANALPRSEEKTIWMRLLNDLKHAEPTEGK